MAQRDAALRAPQAQAPSPLDESAVAEFLLSRKYMLTALELHQELLEGNNGIHNVPSLNAFFNSPEKYAMLVRATESRAKDNAGAALGSAMASVRSPFIVEGLQPAIATRDQQIALLEYQLRQKQQEIEALKSGRLALSDGSSAGSPPGSKGASSGGKPSSSSSAGPSVSPLSSLHAWLGSDEEGKNITHHEKRTLNALVRRYLLARGYKAAFVALAEEVGDQDLSLSSQDYDLLALPGSRGGGRGGEEGSGGASGGLDSVPVLSLLSMHRKRIAPIQALVETEVRTGSEIAALKRELQAVQDQLSLTTAELDRERERADKIQQELYAAKTAAANAPAAASSSGGEASPRKPSSQQQQQAAGAGAGAASESKEGGQASSSSSAAPSSAANAVAAAVASISIANAPVLLRLLADSLPQLAGQMVTKQRSMLLPLLSACIATEVSAEARRKLLQQMLSLLKRPTQAERCMVRVQVQVLANKLGVAAVEAELMPEVLALAKGGKTKERRALAASLCGVLAAQLPEKRVETLLAVLSDLSDSSHVLVRIGVIEGLAAICKLLLDRWERALASGSIMGSNTSLEQFFLRQLAQVEEILWKCLLSSTDPDAEQEELAAAAAAEFPLAIPPALALHGTPAAAAHAQATAEAARNPAASKPPPLQLPGNWSSTPSSISSAAATVLVPIMAFLAFRLGCLWSKLLPSFLGKLSETLQQVSPVAGGAGAAGARPGASAGAAAGAQQKVRLNDWHLRRVQIILGVLSAVAPQVKNAVLDQGYGIRFIGQEKPLPDGSIPNPADWTYDLFDFSSQNNIQAFPAEEGDRERRRKRTRFLLACLLRGVVAVRRRKTAAAEAGISSPWTPIRDEFVQLSWPGLQFLVRTLLTGLVRQAASVSRQSQAGRQIVDSFAETIKCYCEAMEAPFTAFIARPLFMRGLGIPLDIPPPPFNPAAVGGAGAAGGSPAMPSAPLNGRPPALGLLHQILGMATPSPAAVAAGQQVIPWPLQLPELEWMARDSPNNPSTGGRVPKPAAAGNATPGAGAGAAGAAGGAAANSAQQLVLNAGGVWNAESLLPLYGSSVLATPALQPRDLLEHSIRELLVNVSTNRNGWGSAQSLLEDAVLRAGGGGSAGIILGSSSSSSIAAAGGSGGITAGSPSAALTFLTEEVFARESDNRDPLVRANVAGLYRSLIPLLTAGQLRRPFLPVIRKLARDSAPAVVKSAVRALATVYSSAAASEEGVRDEVNAEVQRLLNAGPKDIILEILRALMRAIPSAPPALRDEFILDRLLELSSKIAEAGHAGAAAMEEFCARVGGSTSASSSAAPGGQRGAAGAAAAAGAGSKEVFNAATAAARKARAAAVQASEPWPGAKVEELEEVAIALCECYRAFGSSALSPETKANIRESAMALLQAGDIVDPSYRDPMLDAIDAMFPPLPGEEEDGYGDYPAEDGGDYEGEGGEYDDGHAHAAEGEHTGLNEEGDHHHQQHQHDGLGALKAFGGGGRGAAAESGRRESTLGAGFISQHAGPQSSGSDFSAAAQTITSFTDAALKGTAKVLTLGLVGGSSSSNNNGPAGSNSGSNGGSSSSSGGGFMSAMGFGKSSSTREQQDAIHHSSSFDASRGGRGAASDLRRGSGSEEGGRGGPAPEAAAVPTMSFAAFGAPSGGASGPAAAGGRPPAGPAAAGGRGGPAGVAAGGSGEAPSAPAFSMSAFTAGGGGGGASGASSAGSTPGRPSANGASSPAPGPASAGRGDDSHSHGAHSEAGHNGGSLMGGLGMDLGMGKMWQGMKGATVKTKEQLKKLASD